MDTAATLEEEFRIRGGGVTAATSPRVEIENNYGRCPIRSQESLPPPPREISGRFDQKTVKEGQRLLTPLEF
ncbi:hypothetical protein M569_00783 [Genlisea aurea]|uniref:Uncharacterized protein n=1 Tax=Genlisea aurea TaxID=192259 RepID=S8D3M0_9LAMI|nr:hypothetical protein M569_00783 [Genlisea aurea]